MGIFEKQDRYLELQELLIRERDALRLAQFDQITQISQEKERLANALIVTKLNQSALRGLKEESERNAKLYDAMRAGVKSALDRVKALRKPREALRTYDHTGRPLEFTNSEATTTRRA